MAPSQKHLVASQHDFSDPFAAEVNEAPLEDDVRTLDGSAPDDEMPNETISTPTFEWSHEVRIFWRSLELSAGS